MKRDPSDESCPICGADAGAFMCSLLTHFVWSYEDAIVCGGKGDCDGPGCVIGERCGRLVCARCGDADARGAFVCGTSFGEARRLVNAEGPARLALDAGDS